MPSGSAASSSVILDPSSGLPLAGQSVEGDMALRHDGANSRQRWSPRRHRSFSSMLQVAFSPPGLPKSGSLALLVGEGMERTGTARRSRRGDGRGNRTGYGAQPSSKAARARPARFSGSRGRTVAGGRGRARQAIGAQSAGVLEEAGGHAVAALAREPEAAIAADGLDDEASRPDLPGRAAAPLPLRPLPHEGKGRVEAVYRVARRWWWRRPTAPAEAAWAPLKALADGGEPHPRPRLRAAERALPRELAAPRQSAARARPRGRGAGQTKMRGSAWVRCWASRKAAPSEPRWW